jgi:hypothetical protein
MKNVFTSSNKDNIASVTTIAMAFAIIISGALGSSHAIAHQPNQPAIQQLDTIVVTATRGVDEEMSPVVVKATRSARRN